VELDFYAASCVEKSSRIAIDFNHSGEVYIISEACVYITHSEDRVARSGPPPSSSPLLILIFRSSPSARFVKGLWRVPYAPRAVRMGRSSMGAYNNPAAAQHQMRGAPWGCLAPGHP